MFSPRVIAFTSLAMVAFAGNSLLCRAALRHTSIDPASFITIRLISGAVVLWLIAQARRGNRAGAGSWGSALALFGYAAGFSFAYVSLPTASGALILFSAVQATMIGHGVWKGERPGGRQLLGLMLALGGLAALLLPGLSAPPLAGSLLMMAAGMSWGFYSIRGRSAGDPTKVTAGNFLRAVPIALALSAVMFKGMSLDPPGVLYAVLSGSIASGIGYAIWYAALPFLRSTQAATVQLSVPIIAAVGAILFLREPVTLRLILSSAAVLGGIALVILEKKTAPQA
jgi:drug/metabolite transporter (DMT)-like permease